MSPTPSGRSGHFVVFGLGFGLPLVLLSLLAGARSREIVRWIVAHDRVVEVVAGVLLITVAVVDFADKWESIALRWASDREPGSGRVGPAAPGGAAPRR